MALEVACSNCNGRLLVADPESVVACPHCGAHLSVAGETVPEFSTLAVPPDGPVADELAVSPPADPDVAVETESVVGPPFDGFGGSPPGFPVVEETGSSVLASPEAVMSRSDVLPAVIEADTDASWLQFEAPGDGNGTGILVLEAGSAQPEPAAEAPTPEQSQAAEAPKQPGVSRPLFMLLLSYASAVTLFLAYVLYVVRFGEPHPLESLPDIVPNYRETLPDVEPVTDKQGRVLPQIVAEDAEMPVGHTLRLGQTERFGNVRVTPLKVTRGMLEFEHYSGESDQTKPPVGPVLKLWLKFENVSQDQTFAPLDRPLLYLRGRTRRDDYRLHANHFVAQVDEKSPEDDLVLVYDLVLDDVWDPQGQSLGSSESPRLLEPGEEMVTYVPTQPDGIDELQGQLVWRVHFRKGYHPGSGRGVTTLIEVAFDSEQIETEA